MYLENNRVRHYQIMIFTFWFLVVAWMALIFLLSHQPQEASSQLSRGAAEGVLSVFEPDHTPARIDQMERYVRDAGHALLYLVLALLASFAFDSVQVKDFRNALLVFLVCVLYAASDELHQAFVPGRVSQFSDFLVDLAGIGAGIFLYQTVGIIRYLRSDLQVDRDESLRI